MLCMAIHEKLALALARVASVAGQILCALHGREDEPALQEENGHALGGAHDRGNEAAMVGTRHAVLLEPIHCQLSLHHSFFRKLRESKQQPGEQMLPRRAEIPKIIPKRITTTSTM